MNVPDTVVADRNFQKNAMASFIQIAAVVLLAVWSLKIIAPFISIVLWGMIIAVALYPLHAILSRKLGGREKVSSSIFVFIGLAILLVPAYILTDSSVAALKTVSAQLDEGAVEISPPNPSVAEWPLIGEKVYGVWNGFGLNSDCPAKSARYRAASHATPPAVPTYRHETGFCRHCGYRRPDVQFRALLSSCAAGTNHWLHHPGPRREYSSAGLRQLSRASPALS